MFFCSFVDWFGDVIVMIHQVIFDNQVNNITFRWNWFETWTSGVITK